MEQLILKFEGIDFNPSELEINRYMLPKFSTEEELVGHTFEDVLIIKIAEEIVARLVLLMGNTWVAVNYQDLTQNIINSRGESSLDEIRARNDEKRRAYKRDCRRLKNLFKDVQEPEYEDESNYLHASLLVYDTYPFSLLELGLQYLIKKQLMETELIGGQYYCKLTSACVIRLKNFVKVKG